MCRARVKDWINSHGNFKKKCSLSGATDNESSAAKPVRWSCFIENGVDNVDDALY